MNLEERRLDRYRIIYTWEILEGLVPNGGVGTRETKAEDEEPDRQGRRCRVLKLKAYAVP